MKIDKVAVCSECLRASCWWGEFYCDDYKTAGVVELPRWALEQLALEDPSFWKDKTDETK